MNRRFRNGSMVLLAVLLLCVGVVLAEQVMVEVQVLPIRAGKGSMYGTVAQAKRGDRLDVIQREQDDWLRVQFAGKEGYVKGTALQPRGSTGLSAWAEGATQLTGGTSDVGASAAARGISQDAVNYASSKGMNKAGLEQMIRNRDRVAGARWQQFANEGKVGPAKQQ
jgi:uncharacterized protein YgiM (DUF1202 family)